MAEEMASLAPCTAPSAAWRDMAGDLVTWQQHEKAMGNPWLSLGNVLEMSWKWWIFHTLHYHKPNKTKSY